MAGLLPVDDALHRLLDDVTALPAERVPVGEAAGRVLAATIEARRTQPPFPASAMDGYAVRAADIADQSTALTVIGQSIAGKRFAGSVEIGQAVRIFTGAPVPDGADAVLLQEDAEPDEDGRTIRAREAVAPGRHIRAAGLDFRAGDVLLPKGRVLDAAALSLAAAGNHPVLSVVRAPLVAILATGSELLPPGSEPGPDQIIASNGYGVAALARDVGARVLDLGIAPDDRDVLADRIRDAISAGGDVIVTLGGASVGDHDLVREVLEGEGMALDFWKIAMRPGKPLMFGRLGETRVLGLPGNPVSSLVCAHLFLKPLLAKLGGRTHVADIRDAVLGDAMKANDHRQDYVRAAAAHEDGHLVARPFAVQDSSMLTTLAQADALIIREPNAAASEAGDACRVLMLRRALT